MKTGKYNLISRILKYYGYELGKMSMNLTLFSLTGLNGHAEIDSLVIDSFLVDTVRLAIASRKAQ